MDTVGVFEIYYRHLEGNLVAIWYIGSNPVLVYCVKKTLAILVGRTIVVVVYQKWLVHVDVM
jgi:hypothetical protein